MIKSIVILITLLASLSSFAGDLNLMCEDVTGDDFHYQGLEEGKASVEFTDKDIYGGEFKYNVSVVVKEDKNVFSITKTYLGENPGKAMTYSVTTESWSDYFRVSNNITCAIRD